MIFQNTAGSVKASDRRLISIFKKRCIWYLQTEIKVTNIRIKDEESIQRALLEGWHFEDEALFLNALSQKRERVLATLEKYRP